MNNRLKYKVFDKRDNKLKEIKGYTFSLMELEGIVYIQWANGYYECNIPFKDLIFCQCTGLKDRNKKDIYEGDIVKQCWHIYIITNLSRGSFQIKDIKTKSVFNIYALCAEKSEIIGNIYTTPELLEEQC